MKRAALALTALLGACSEPSTQGVGVPTWNEEVGPLVHSNCLPCHLPDGAAPFALVSSRDVRKRGRQVLEVTHSGFMPPWLPDADGPRFKGERGLSEEELALLTAWVEGGGPVGDGPEPTAPAAEAWPLGPPDKVLETGGWVDIPAEGDGVLHTVVLPTSLEVERDLVAVQFLPSTPRALHGVGWLWDLTGYGLRADESYPGPGFREMGGAGMNTIGALGAWAPGRTAIPLPAGYGMPVEGDGAFMVQLHFNGTGKPEQESSKLGLYFADSPREKTVMDFIMGSLRVDIAPGDSAYLVTDEITLAADAELLGLYPKARYVCSRLRVTAVPPGGGFETLLSISDYDFNWLEPLWYVEPRALEAGTRISLEYIYDNSAANLRNPQHPPQRVGLGRNAEDEMAFLMLYLATDDQEDLEALEAQHRQGFLDRIQDRRDWHAGR